MTRWREGRGDKALARWRTTAQAAAKQSRRSRFPVVADLASTHDVVDRLRAAAAGVLLHEEAVVPLADLVPPAEGSVVVVVGPEGGLSPEELAAFTEAGATAYRLGPTVLRTSTAGTAALAVLLARCPPLAVTAGYRTVKALVSTWIGEPSSAEASKARSS